LWLEERLTEIDDEISRLFADTNDAIAETILSNRILWQESEYLSLSSSF